jgi:hypothetical protein
MNRGERLVDGCQMVDGAGSFSIKKAGEESLAYHHYFSHHLPISMVSTRTETSVDERGKINNIARRLYSSQLSLLLLIIIILVTIYQFQWYPPEQKRALTSVEK